MPLLLRKIIPFCLFAFAVLTVQRTYAQKAAVKGILVDSVSRLPLEFATVAIVNVKDTSLVSYTLTDKKGFFSLTALPVGKGTRMIVSFVGYKTIRQNLFLKKGETKDFGTILFAGQLLNEVVIQGSRSPVVIKKDTIEFNTEAFKTRPNAVVEELLKKLPGVQVNYDGSILVNGKEISKLLINDKEFFGTDPKIATRNLDADLIDKVQVYDDREEDPNHKISASEVKKIINLKLKSKIKKSTIGKIYAGGGTRGTYEGGGIMSNFRDTLQISVMALANDLNNTGFSSEELRSLGGYDRSQNGPGLYNIIGGIEKLASGGFNINNDYGKKLKMNLMYTYTHRDFTNNGNNFTEQNLTDTKLSSYTENHADQISNKNQINGLLQWRPDTLNMLNYRPEFSISTNHNTSLNSGNTFNSQNPRLSDYNNKTNGNADNNSFAHHMYWYRRFKEEGKSLAISHELKLAGNPSDIYTNNSLTSYTSNLNSEVLDRYANHKTKNNYADIGITYTSPIYKKLSLELGGGLVWITGDDRLFTFDKNVQNGTYDLLLSDQSNTLNRISWVYILKPQLVYDFNKNSRLQVGINGQEENVQNKFNTSIPDLNKHYFNLFPMLSFYRNGLWIKYSENIEQPPISQMQPIVRESSQLYKEVGNPDLNPQHSHTLSVSFYKSNPGKQINFSGYGDIRLIDNDVVQKNSIDENGATTVNYLNRNGTWNIYGSLNFGKQFKKTQDLQVGLKTDLSFSLNRKAFFLNSDEGIQNNYSVTVGEGVNLDYKKLMLNTNYSFSQSITDYKRVNYNSVHTNIHSLNTDVSVRWPKRMIISGNYNFSYNPQVPAGFQKSANILNLSIAQQMFKKDRGQLKLSVYDLFDQNISIYRYAMANSITTSQTQILKRYFLLTYQYKFNFVHH